MPNADHTAAASLDHDLDALVTGTPEHDHASDRTSDPATSADLRRAAHQFHGLAARADRRAEDAATRQTLDSIWENVMNTHVPSATTIAPPATLIPERRPRSPLHLRRSAISPGAIHWHGIANGLLAAVLILAIAAGFWRAYDFQGPGRDGDGDQASHLAGLTAQDATPSGSPVRVDMPTAEDCTVEPLTVDRVMELVEDPYDLGETVGTPGPPPPSVIEPSTYPTQEVMDEIDAVHRQVVACAMAGSPFQVWALVQPELIGQDVLQALPVFADESEVRAYLEGLEAGLSDEQVSVLQARYGFATGPSLGEVATILMVDPNPRNSITLPTDQTLDIVRVGALVCTLDGGVERIYPGVLDKATESQTYFEYQYSSYSTAGGRWVLNSIPGAG
jgi:hypothetical protein